MAFYLNAIIVFVCICSFPANANDLRPAIGFNKFDLFRQYLGTASGGNGSLAYQKVTRAMGRKSILDARDSGAIFFRVSASGFFPSAYHRPGDLDLWLKDRPKYWALFDEMMADLSASDIRIVPVFVWNAMQFPAMTDETVDRMLKDPQSRSYQLLEEYVLEFVARYKFHPALYFYELTNELNLGADIDTMARCSRAMPPALCGPKGNYSTDDLIVFTRRLAEAIRSVDPNHLISSGFSVPRMSAEHLRRRPEWSKDGADWTPDSPLELKKHLSDTHENVDIISAHIYPVAGNRRFGAGIGDEDHLLEVIKRASDDIGKPLFIGEFGESGLNKEKNSGFVDKMLGKIVRLKVPYSALWAWEFYQTNPFTTYDNQHTLYNLEPGYTDSVIAKVKQANQKLGHIFPENPLTDTTPPRLILTWPLDCTALHGRQNLHVTASDDMGRVKQVNFWFLGQKIHESTSPPYEFTLDTDNVEPGKYDLVITAYDMAGNMAEYSTAIWIKNDPGKFDGCDTLLHH